MPARLSQVSWLTILLVLCGCTSGSEDAARKASAKSAADRKAAEDAAVAVLEEAGAKIRRRESGWVNVVELDTADAGDAIIDQLAKLPELSWLYFGSEFHANKHLTDAGLASVAQLQQIERLYLTGTAVGDDGVKHLGALKRLEVLDLSGTKVTDAAIPALAALDLLKLISLERTAVTDRGLMPLAELPRLKIVRALGSQVTSDGAAAFEKKAKGVSVMR